MVALDDWPLVGRTAELHRLKQLIADDDAHGVVLVGAPGVGKTRLAVESLRAAERAHYATARATATRSASAVPFGALAALLPPARPGEEEAVHDRADLLRRTAAALTGPSADRRLVLLVDDAHHLDDASATLLHHLVATGGAFVLATSLAGVPAPDPLVAMWKDGLVERFEIPGLRAGAIEELLSAVLSGPVDPAAIAQLVVRCEGNVLFLRELVRGALGDGSLVDEDGMWRLVGPLSPSDRLVELVEDRLAGLDHTEREALELVSFGEPLGPADLTALGYSEIAETLERKGLLAGTTTRRRLSVRLAHPLYGEVLRAQIPSLRIRTLARTLAEAVEATGARRREDTLRVATWRLEGGGARPELMLAAATGARWRFDFSLAERLVDAALEAGAGFDAALLRAQLASLQGRIDDAEAQLAELASTVQSDSQRGLVAITRLDNYVFYRGRIADGLAVAEQAEAAIADPAWRDEVTAHRSTITLALRGPRAAVEAVEPLLDRATGRTLVWACLVGSYALSRLGRLDAALAAAAKGEAGRQSLAQPLEWYPSFHVFARCEALAHAGRLNEVETLATAEHEQGLAAGSAETQALFAWQLAKTVGDRGHVGAAARHAREAAVLFRELGRPQFERECLVYLALALALAGRHGDADHVLGRLTTGAGPPALFTAGVDLLIARGWTAVAGADLATARSRLIEAADLGEEIGDLVAASTALHGLARISSPPAGRSGSDVLSQAARRLEALAPQIEGDLARARARHGLALAAPDPDALLEVSQEFENMGAHLLAADAAAAAAVTWAARGDSRTSAGARHRTDSLVTRCAGAVTPALVARGERERLTPSEREAALLAAAGRSNRDIADRLYLSVRTVENRLQRVYEKLGVSSRRELADALGLD